MDEMERFDEWLAKKENQAWLHARSFWKHAVSTIPGIAVPAAMDGDPGAVFIWSLPGILVEIEFDDSGDVDWYARDRRTGENKGSEIPVKPDDPDLMCWLNRLPAEKLKENYFFSLISQHRSFPKSVEVVLASGWRGRAFALDPVQLDDMSKLQKQLLDCFADVPDDISRLELVEQAIKYLPTIDVEWHHGNLPGEFHAYIVMPQFSAHPVFACVLATPAVLNHLLLSSPVVFETSAFQAITEETPTSTGLEEWASRIWPKTRIPPIHANMAAEIGDQIFAVKEQRMR